MKLSEEHIELAEKYLRGQLEEQESKEFAAKLEADEELRAEVEALQAALIAVEADGILQMKKELEQIRQQVEVEKKSSRPVNWWLIAASFALLAAVTWAALKFIEPDPPQEIFAENFEVYRPPVQLRDDASGESSWAKGRKAYGDGDYAAAAQHFEDAKSDPQVPQYLREFYIGIAQLAEDKAEAAIPHLQTSLETESDYSQQARWYLALAYLAVDDIDNSRSVLYKIISNESAYKYKAAKKILADLPPK